MAVADTPQKLYGDDSGYYIGLRCLSEGKIDEAEQLFESCSKKGSHYAAQRSMEQLTLLGNVQDRIAACAALVKKYPEERSYLIAAREFAADNEYARLIAVTDSIDIVKCSNELAGLRLTALYQKKDSRFAESEYQWFSGRPLSDEQYKLYTATTTDEHQTDKNAVPGAQNAVIDFRINIYQRNYHIAYDEIAGICAAAHDGSVISLVPQIISDMGRACLYGNNQSVKDARMFCSIAETAEKKGNNENAFFAWFYAARLYDKNNDFLSASTDYRRAMDAAEAERNGDQYDNALWYMLNSSLVTSIDSTIATIEQYCKEWHSPSYFDDFFDTLSPLLLANARWNDFGRIYKMVDGYASDEVTAKYAYIYGRLLEMHLANTPGDREESAVIAFTRALNGGTGVYYEVLAAGQLDISDADILQKVCAPVGKKGEDNKEDEAAERLVQGYAEFGLPEYIYNDWLMFFKDGTRFSEKASAELAGFLQKCGDSDDKYYSQSIRIATQFANESTGPFSGDILKLEYPQDYKTYVKESSDKFGLQEEVLYALIRSESFFDPSIISTAGATGLTQLMEFTAADIAQRLHRPDYNPTDPEGNIEFGAYYLASLIKRLNGSMLTAFFSYNAGISRVRRWIQSSQIELQNQISVNYDLFLETIPYPETREYGRKIVSAAVMYGMLYYNKSAADIVSELMK